jgi:hypothetical protein
LGVGQPIHKFPTAIMGRGGFFRLSAFDLFGLPLDGRFRADFFPFLRSQYGQDGPPGHLEPVGVFGIGVRMIPNFYAELVVSFEP